MEYNYDLLVIGAGPGGYVAAIRASQLGLKTAVAENRDVGGTCLNRGCIPTKSYLHTGELFRQTKEFELYGLSTENTTLDMKRALDRKNDVVTKLRLGVEQLFKSGKIDHFAATATIIEPHKALLTPVDGSEKSEITAKFILIATGSVPSLPPVEGCDLENVITSDELLDMDRLYDNFIVAGAGVIGMEFVGMYNSFGKNATLMASRDRILPKVDKEIAQNLTMILKKRGVKILTKARLKKITKDDDGMLRCWYLNGDQMESITGDGVLLASGRKANTKNLFAEGFEGVKMTEKGEIEVDGQYRTSVPNIFAIGDVIPGKQLAHVASAEGICAVEIMAGHEPSIDVSVIPDCIYTDPEIACTGLTEAEAKEMGIKVKVAKAMTSSNGKSLIANQDRGFVKIVYDEENDRIIGAQLMCARATDMINEFSTAIVNKLSKKQMQAVIRPHPTFGEMVTEAVDELDSMAIHIAHRK